MTISVARPISGSVREPMNTCTLAGRRASTERKKRRMASLRSAWNSSMKIEAGVMRPDRVSSIQSARSRGASPVPLREAPGDAARPCSRLITATMCDSKRRGSLSASSRVSQAVRQPRASWAVLICCSVVDLPWPAGPCSTVTRRLSSCSTRSRMACRGTAPGYTGGVNSLCIRTSDGKPRSVEAGSSAGGVGQSVVASSGCDRS
ncbi:hypothetical protein X551_02485 [Methylibium sp. T29]|nr:hypothetical protein X551_02485 [Methylibium sp. T29]